MVKILESCLGRKLCAMTVMFGLWPGVGLSAQAMHLQHEMARLELASLLPSSQSPEKWQSPLLQEHPLVGKIVDLNAGKEISESALLKDLQGIQYVLIGEKHDNPDHHLLEKRLLSGMLGSSAELVHPAVVFEMLTSSQQSRIDQLSAQQSLAEMKSVLQWPEKSWNWNDYAPLFQVVLQMQGTLLGGNIDSAKMKDVYQNGEAALSDERFSSIPRLNTEQQNLIREQIFESHCEMMPRDSLSPMVQLQMAKDASMAYTMKKQDASRVILVSGGFHTAKNIGVPQHLYVGQADASVRVIMLLEVDEQSLTVDDYSYADSDVADYVWFTPRATDKDYCAGLRKSHGKQQ